MNDEQLQKGLSDFLALDPDAPQWFADRPESIKAAMRLRPPLILYKLLTSDHLVTILTYDEVDPVRATVAVTRQFNAVDVERAVFGVKLEELEPLCHMSDSEQYEVKYPEVVKELLETANAGIHEMLPTWQAEADKLGIAVGDDRRKFIFDKIDEYERGLAS